MTAAEALSVFDRAKHWRIGDGGCSLTMSWFPRIEAVVRRKRDESLTTMVVRCAALAILRERTNWQDPRVLPRTAACGACGRGNAFGDLRRDTKLKMALCSECRKGLREMKVIT